LTVKDIGLQTGATTDEICARAEELGLELCPAEVGPNLRLQSSDKEWMYVAMKQITDRDGYPSVFYLVSDDGRLWLEAGSAEPDMRWGDGLRFVFRFRKIDTKEL
jgi:hypothetical protein